MADDPRRQRLVDYLRNTDVSGSLSLIADDTLAHLDAVDPLRALLADDGRALETMVRAWWDGQFGVGSWPDGASGTEARQLDAMRPVLAALREVAGL